FSRTNLCRWPAKPTSSSRVRLLGAFLAYSANALVMVAGVRLRIVVSSGVSSCCAATLASRSQNLIVVRAQQRKQQVIGPSAVDAHILPCKALFMEAPLGKHGLGRLIVRQASRLQTMQAKFVEHKRQHGAQTVGHQTLAGMRLAHPVADRSGLCHATAHVAKVD